MMENEGPKVSVRSDEFLTVFRCLIHYADKRTEDDDIFSRVDWRSTNVEQ